jgi:hypothetical protein
MLAAYAVLRLHYIPREHERVRNAKLIEVSKRANVEAAGLRKVLESSELKMRDIRAAVAGIDEGLRRKLQKMPARDQSALDALIGQGTFSGLLSVLRNGALVERRLMELQRSWSRGVNERESVRALCENLWLLEPGLTSEGHIFSGKTLGVVAEAYFGMPQPADDLSMVAARKKPAAVGMFRRRTAIARPDDPGERTLVIIEARRPGDSISQAVVSAAVGYAHAIRKLVPELSQWPIECLVIGGSIDEDAQFAANHAPPGSPVRLATWSGLLTQARMRRPETVNLNAIRLDGDQPPVYDLNARSRVLGAFLDLEDEASEQPQHASRAQGEAS